MRTLRIKATAAAAIALALSLTGVSSAVASSAVTPSNPASGTRSDLGSDMGTVLGPQTANPCSVNRAGVNKITVTIHTQSLVACHGKALVLSTPVTTGASSITDAHYATPAGEWTIKNKVRNTVLAGHDVNGSWWDPVQYWMPFYLGYGFHDASWQKFPFGSTLYKTRGSHGCVHVPTAAMKTLYGWAGIGTIVSIVK